VRTAVDTNVLLDLLAGDPAAAASARSAIANALGLGSLAVCPMVYAELGANFPDQEELTRFIRAFHIQVDDFSAEALFMAAAAWRRHARNRGKEIQCPRCGQRTEVLCPSCGTPLSWRQHILPDFLVGAHAAAQADRLLTRDPYYYRRYFPAVTVLAP
jgi:predicted nucleic acid-binding protein